MVCRGETFPFQRAKRKRNKRRAWLLLVIVILLYSFLVVVHGPNSYPRRTARHPPARTHKSRRVRAREPPLLCLASPVLISLPVPAPFTRPQNGDTSTNVTRFFFAFCGERPPGARRRLSLLLVLPSSPSLLGHITLARSVLFVCFGFWPSHPPIPAMNKSTKYLPCPSLPPLRQQPSSGQGSWQ